MIQPVHETPEIEVLAPQVQQLLMQAQSLLREQDEMIWKHWTEGAPVNISKTYEGKENLFSPDSIQKIERLRNLSAQSREKIAATHLLVHFIGEYLARSLSEDTEAIANLESSVSFTHGGKEVPLRNLDRVISSEKSQPKREAIYAAATEAVGRFSQLVRIRREKAEEKLRLLGYSYATYSSLLREADFAEVGAIADQFLSGTESAYRKSLADVAKRELPADPDNLRRADLIKLLHLNRLDAPFGKDSLVERLQATASVLSLDLSAMPNVKVDSTENPRKNSQPLCLALTVPSDVRLSIRPSGGERIYAGAFHELGHLLHYATSQESRFELAKLGNTSLYEASALLFERLPRDETWVSTHLSYPKDKVADFVVNNHFAELHRLRLAAAHILYEVALGVDPGPDPAAAFQTIFSRALGINMNPDEVARYLVEQEDLYSSVDTFRAGLFSAQLESHLKNKFGASWWRRSEAGQFLRELWAPANGISIDEAARRLGAPKLSAATLIQYFEAPESGLEVKAR